MNLQNHSNVGALYNIIGKRGIMEYIYGKFENEEFWLELDEEYGAIRQMILSKNKIQISFRDDCLAEGIVNIEELDGDFEIIAREKFEDKWNKISMKIKDDFEEAKLRYKVGEIVSGNILDKYNPFGIIISISENVQGQVERKNLNSKGFDEGKEITGEICGYDEYTMRIKIKKGDCYENTNRMEGNFREKT